MKLLLFLLICLMLVGCDLYRPQLTYESDKKGHLCSTKPDHPMPGATYCEWNYARGYANGLKDCCKYPSRREHICHPEK